MNKQQSIVSFISSVIMVLQSYPTDFFGILVIKCILSLGRFSKSPAVYGLGDIKTLISLRVMVLLITLHHTRSNESTKEV